MVLRGVLQRAANQLDDVLVREGVEEVLPAPAPLDQSLSSKGAELLGDRGQPGSSSLGKLADAPFSIHKPREQLEAGNFAGCAKETGSSLECVIVDGQWLSPARSVVFGSAACFGRGRGGWGGRTGHHFTNNALQLRL